MKKVKIIVATHKEYQIPNDDIYIPIHVGREGKEDIGYISDNTGDNISSKNAFYSELTGMYWAWKNLDADYIGLCHYRRYFSCARNIPKCEKEKFNVILNRNQIEKILQTTDIILPKKRKYYIETLYSHYKHTMYIEPLDETKKIIHKQCPEYLVEFNKLYKRTSAHMFNMFIMKKEYFNSYCEWLFKILFELEKRINPEQYDSFHARYLGRISELLLDVWINTNRLNYKEISVIDMQNINWVKKSIAFLKAKFFSKKYQKSF